MCNVWEYWSLKLIFFYAMKNNCFVYSNDSCFAGHGRGIFCDMDCAAKLIYLYIFCGMVSTFHCREQWFGLIWIYIFVCDFNPFFHCQPRVLLYIRWVYFVQKSLVARPRCGNHRHDARQYEEWYISSDFCHNSSQSVNFVLPDTD